MALTLAACGAKPSDGGRDEDKDGYTVAIIKQMDHASLDEIADAIAARLDAIAQEQNVSIRYTITSGQGDQSVLKQLADQAVADKVDAIIPIATTAAQVSAVAAEDSRTPVVYAAISDPDTAKLTGIDYVTGTSDALNTEYILDMMLAQDPGVSKVGLLYSLSEPNSTKPIAEAKAYLEQHGITCVEQTANTNDEVVAAAAALISAKVDAVFTPTDNVIMAAELAIADDLAKAGIPHYTGADSFVRNGAYRHLWRQLHRAGRTHCRRWPISAMTAGHGRDGGLLPDGRRHHHRQHRHRRRAEGRLLRVCPDGPTGGGHHHQGLMLSD